MLVFVCRPPPSPPGIDPEPCARLHLVLSAFPLKATTEFKSARVIEMEQQKKERKPDTRPATPVEFIEGDNFLLLHKWIHEWMVYAMGSQLNTFALQRMQQKMMEEQSKHTQAQRAAMTEAIVGEKRQRSE